MATTTGAIAAIDSDRPPPLLLDSIPIIDLSLLSQSELLSLSLCSNSSFDLNRCDDVVIPKIDRSVFNESAGSRKQTYSRLRLAPAQSPTSTKTTIHRRTPRLRSSHTPTSNNINAAEQAENSQIIRMLKELFKSDHNFEDLDPIEVEIDTNVAVPEILNPQTSRKRGRPRKDENAVFIHPPAAKRICNNTVKKLVAYDADRDIEIVNSRGVKVNLENLGMLEDPYGLEIRRKTEGMSTKDEFLGFLGGLNGEWATSRKKRRIVDASDFGDALPKGWRLSLSIKKKLDRFWLFCRRYISPSGREFESCKEVSMYLLSLVREEKLDKSVHPQSKNSDDFVSKKASVKERVFFREDTRRNKPIVLALSSRDFKKQVKSNIVDPIDVQVEEVFKCLKCFLIFEGKDSLLDHQVLAHKTEISQLGSEISEWMVVKGGIFECQFCNKTFNESNQYNEHIGAHVTNDIKTSEASEAPTTEKTVVMESHDPSFDDKLVSSSPQSDIKIIFGTESEINEPVHDLNILAHDNDAEDVNMNEDVLVEESGGQIEKKCNVDGIGFPEIDKDPKVITKVNMLTESESGCEIGKKCDVDDIEITEIDKKDPNVSVSKSDFCLGDEASMPIDESNVNLESSVLTVDCVDDKSECIIKQGTNDLMGSVEENVVGESATVDVLNFADSETRFQSSNTCEKNGFQENINDAHICSSFDDLASEKEKVVNEDHMAEVNKLSDSETRVQSSNICGKNGFQESINDAYTCSSFDDLASEKEKVINEDHMAEVNKLFDSETLALDSHNASLIPSEKQDSPQKLGFAVPVDHVTRDFEQNRFPNGIANSRVEGQQEFRSSAIESYNISTSMDGVTSDEKENNFKSLSSYSQLHEKERLNEPQTEMVMEDFGLENDVNNNACSNRSTEVNLDGLQVFKNHEVNGLNLNMGFNAGENLEFCSVVPPAANEQEFNFQDDIFDQSGDERGFLDHFSIPESYDDIDIFDEERSIGINELSLAFGDPQHEQKKDWVNSKIEDTFDVQTDLSMANNNNSMMGDFKGGGETKAFSHNGNAVYQQQSGLANGNDGFSLNGFRSEPVEFSFLTGRSEGGSSGVFPYNNNTTGMNQVYMGSRNVITSVCAWCRNEFQLQPEIQGGVASLCPTCSGQVVNML